MRDNRTQSGFGRHQAFLRLADVWHIHILNERLLPLGGQVGEQLIMSARSVCTSAAD